jgi:DNA polymerase V
LQELTPTSEFQFDIFCPAPRVRSERLMSTVDLINRRFNRDALQFATQGQTQPWKMKCDMRSPDYLAQWQQLRAVRA